MRNLQDSMTKLRESDEHLAAKVQAIEVLVAGDYVTHTHLEKMTDALFLKLDKIDDKLDRKADK